MSDFADEMDAAGQDHDLTTGDPAPKPKGLARIAAVLSALPLEPCGWCDGAGENLRTAIPCQHCT